MSGRSFLVRCDILTLYIVTHMWLMEDRQPMNIEICSVLHVLVSYNEGFQWLAAGWQWRANQSSTWMSNIHTTICFLPVESCALSWKCYQSAFFIIWFEWLTSQTSGCSAKWLNIQFCSNFLFAGDIWPHSHIVSVAKVWAGLQWRAAFSTAGNCSKKDKGWQTN